MYRYYDVYIYIYTVCVCIYIYIHVYIVYNPLYNPIGDIPSEDRHHVGSVQNPVGSPEKTDWLVESGIPQSISIHWLVYNPRTDDQPSFIISYPLKGIFR